MYIYKTLTLVLCALTLMVANTKSVLQVETRAPTTPKSSLSENDLN